MGTIISRKELPFEDHTHTYHTVWTPGRKTCHKLLMALIICRMKFVKFKLY